VFLFVFATAAVSGVLLMRRRMRMMELLEEAEAAQRAAWHSHLMPARAAEEAEAQAAHYSRSWWPKAFLM